MLFTDATFIFYFLPVALLLHRLSTIYGKAGTYHNFSRLTLFSLTLFFYGYQEPWWLLPLGTCIGFDFLWATLISQSRNTRRKNLWLLCSIGQNLFLLGIFKYWGSIISVIESHFPQWIGILPRLQTGGITLTLPAGISFYTFESLSFIIDVYRGQINVPRNPLEFFAFIGMFPRFIAGPIVRYQFMAGQFIRYGGMQIEKGLSTFVLGLFFKICFADHFSLFTRYAFNRTDSIEFLSAWLGVYSYAMQLYFDFFGYTLMAIGLGRCLGFEFPANFNKPYHSSSIQEFWTRWHITLGTWVRDYFHYPLALWLRKNQKLSFLAPFLSMVLIGLWHGPRITYILMGVWFGFLICLEHYFSIPQKTGKTAGRTVTFTLVLLGWVLLKSNSINEALRVYQAMINPFHNILSFNATLLFSHPIALVSCALGTLYCFVIEPRTDWLRFSEKPAWIKTTISLAMFTLSLVMAFSEEMIPFLYFQF